MIKFFKALPRLTKTAFYSLARHLAMAMTASSVVAITLTVLSLFLILAGNIAVVTDSIQQDLQIHVVLKSDVTSKKQLEQTKKEIENIKNVKKARFSSKDEELELMIKERGEAFQIYKGEKNPLSHGYFVSVKNAKEIKKTTEDIQKLNPVKDAKYGGTSVSKLVSVLEAIHKGGIIFIGLLTLLAIFLISNAIKLTIYARSNEIAIMRNVGAMNWYIKVPFMIEGMLIGLIGSIVPCIITYFGYQYIYELFAGQLEYTMFQLIPAIPFTFKICGIVITGSMIVGFIGSMFATNKYLKVNR